MSPKPSKAYQVPTEDGLYLEAFRFCKKPSRNVVVLFPGMTLSHKVFILPEIENLVSILWESGFTDVWCGNWRSSSALPYNEQNRSDTLDDVALFDMPAFFRVIQKECPSAHLHVYAHCLGAMSMSMALVSGLLPKLNSFIAASVSLYPEFSPLTQTKLLSLARILKHVFRKGYVEINPLKSSPLSLHGAIQALASSSRFKCDSTACKTINFMWGSHEQTLFNHDNLNPITHDKLHELFGAVPLSYFRHLERMVTEKAAVKYHLDHPKYSRLPNNYLKEASKLSTPLMLLSGARNDCFGNSQAVCHEIFKEQLGNSCSRLELIPGYGHLDVLVGKHAHVDVFPKMIEFFEEHSS